MDCIKGHLAYGFILTAAAINKLTEWLPANLDDILKWLNVISCVCGTVLAVQTIIYQWQKMGQWKSWLNKRNKAK